MIMRRAVALLLALPLIQANASEPASTPAAAQAQAQTQAQTQDAALLEFLDQAFDEQVRLSPETQTHLGFKTDYDRLDDRTDAAALRARDLAERQLRDMRARFKPEQLGESARVSFRLFEYEVERERESFRFRRPASRYRPPAARPARSRCC
jgi:uncharacterized protein (DUF885 family)